MSPTLTIIRTVLSEVMQEDVGPITMDTDLSADIDLDSILFVQFLLALEERLPGLEFNQETLTELAFHRVGSLVEHLDNHLLVKAG